MSEPPAGRVVELWRYPVKSMGGEQVERLRLHARGVHGDRLWAVRDLEAGAGEGRTATARRVPGLLLCHARYAEEPPAEAGPGRPWPVLLTLPDGTEVSSDDDAVHEALSEAVGRSVRLVPLPPTDERAANRGGLRTQAAIRRDLGIGRDEPLPDGSFLPARTIARLARYTTPPGTFVDVAGLHVLTTTSLASIAATGVDADVRRFRPNVLVELDGPDGTDGTDGAGAEPFPERAWVGQDVALGEAATASVSMPTIRCVVPSREQPGLARDKEITRVVAEVGGRFLGVYAESLALGAVATGDVVRPLGATRRGALERLGEPVARLVKGPAMRLGSRLMPQGRSR